MVYILGHRPHEFGLIPDPEGFVTYKELIRAVNEEPGWSYVRRANINEVLLGANRDLFQTLEEKIRAVERRWVLDLDRPALSLPKILYTGIRRRAHPFIMEKGLRPITGGKFHVLSPEREMAERIGKKNNRRVRISVNIPVKAKMRSFSEEDRMRFESRINIRKHPRLNVTATRWSG